MTARWCGFLPRNARAAAIRTVHAAVVESFQPPFDMAKLPRMTAHIYRTEDEMSGLA